MLNTCSSSGLELLVVVQDGVKLGLFALDVARELADLLREARLLRNLVLGVGFLDRLRDLGKPSWSASQGRRKTC